MALNASPSIACIGIIGKHDNPLHTSLFPPHTSPASSLNMSFALNSSLDIFHLRTRASPLSQDLGLLHALDERLAAYGWLTNTGIKFVIIVDMLGRQSEDEKGVVGLRDADLKPAFRAVQAAYIGLLLNGFYSPEDREPWVLANREGRSAKITSRRFMEELQRVGREWYPGITNL